MKDWEWFALGLIPFAGAPVQFIRYAITGKTSSPAQMVAGAIVGQGVAYGLQKAGFYKVSEALMLHRAAQLGFVVEGSGATGYSPYSFKQVKNVKYGPLRSSGVGWRPTFAMRMATPLIAAGFIGLIANSLSTAPGHRRMAYAHARQAKFQGYGPEDYI